MLIAGLASCVPNKRIVYLQDTNETADTLYQTYPNNYKLQNGDIVGIEVKMATDNPILQNIFDEPPRNFNMNSGSSGGGDFFYLNGYTLDDSGYISLPVVGRINLSGMTIFEANNRVQTVFDQYLSNSYITVRFGGLRYAVMGEVRRPGKYVTLQNRMTIFEALANAGDLTELAKRDKVTIIRQYPEGSRIHEINLLDEQIIRSPYYYIQPNDLIYIQPLKIRALGTGTNALQSVTAIATILSATILAITLFK